MLPTLVIAQVRTPRVQSKTDSESMKPTNAPRSITVIVTVRGDGMQSALEPALRNGHNGGMCGGRGGCDENGMQWVW